MRETLSLEREVSLHPRADLRPRLSGLRETRRGTKNVNRLDRRLAWPDRAAAHATSRMPALNRLYEQAVRRHGMAGLHQYKSM